MKSFYKPSGKASPVSLAIFIVISLTLIPLLSYLYVVIQDLIPLIYFKIFITAGFGLAISYIIAYGVIHSGRVRNTLLAVLYGIGAGFIAVYIHWAIWLNWILAGEERSLQYVFFFITNPKTMFDNIKMINEVGLWSIGKLGREGTLVNGTFLMLIWIGEALIITVMAVIQPINFSKLPFCENTNKWFKKSNLGKFGAVNHPEKLLERIDSDDLNAFDNLAKPSEDFHSEWYLNTCDVEFSYLTIFNMIPSYEKNKVQFTKKEVVRNLQIKNEMKNALTKHIKNLDNQ